MMQAENLHIEDDSDVIAFTDTISRMKVAAGVTSDIDLARALDVPKGTLSSWRTRESIPLDHLINASRKLRISIDSIVFSDAGLGKIREHAIAIALYAVDHFYLQVEMKNKWHSAFWRSKILMACIKSFEDEIVEELQKEASLGKASEAIFFKFEENPKYYYSSIIQKFGTEGLSDMLSISEAKAFQ